MKICVFLVGLIFVTSVFGQTCPVRCPSCTKCDPKKGTCTVARDFVTCTKNSFPGVCFAGLCNTQLSLPVIRAANKCQTYSCPVFGTCSLITAPDGTDCTPSTATTYESVCLSGVCQRVWLGVGEDMPFQNIGCVGVPDGSVCDTNHLLIDGEKCVGGVCRHLDGTYYGYIPG
jgi:hypothetical protein